VVLDAEPLGVAKLPGSSTETEKFAVPVPPLAVPLHVVFATLDDALAAQLIPAAVSAAELLNK
jgi:hypothetical protein